MPTKDRLEAWQQPEMNMTIARKLYLLISSVVIGFILVTGLSIFELNKVNTVASYSTVNTVPSLLDLGVATKHLATIRVLIWRYLADPSSNEKASIAKTMSESHEKVVAALAKYEKDDLSDDTDKGILEAEKATFAEYEKMREKAQTLADAGSIDEARKLMANGADTVAKMEKAFDLASTSVTTKNLVSKAPRLLPKPSILRTRFPSV